MSVFRLTAFPANDGDCLLLSYGTEAKLHHILIDGGRRGAYKFLRPAMEQIAARGEAIDLHVLTHIDADHIEGMLALAEDEQLPVAPKHVWYNGFDQMKRLPTNLAPFGEQQGDDYSAALARLGWPVNERFDGKAISVEGAPDAFDYEGLKITLVSPDNAHLQAMRARWRQWRTEKAAKKATERLAGGLEAMGRRPMPDPLDVAALSATPEKVDPEAPNGSSIAFVAEFAGKCILLAGDAHPDLLAQTIGALAVAEGGRYHIDLFKLSHHGSKNNISRALIETLDCDRFLISTNGKIHGHPDPEAIARILAFGPTRPKTLYFNYVTERTTPWDDQALKAKHGYDCVFSDGAPLTLDI